EGRAHPDVANALVDLGQILEDRDDLSGACRCHQRALRILGRARNTSRSRADPDVDRLRCRAAALLGNVLRALGRHAAANDVLGTALRQAVAWFGARDLDVAGVLNNLGVLRKYEGRYAGAARYYRRALAIVSRSSERRGEAAATLYHNLGGLEHARGRHARGEPHARRSVALREALLGPGHPAVAADVAALAALLDGQGKRAEAARLYRRALAVFRRKLGPSSSEVAINLCSLGMLRQAEGRLGEAERLLRRALAIHDALYGPGHPEAAMTANNLAMLLAARGRDVEARALCRRALAAFARVLGARHPHTRRSAENLAAIEARAAGARTRAGGAAQDLRPTGARRGRVRRLPVTTRAAGGGWRGSSQRPISAPLSRVAAPPSRS